MFSKIVVRVGGKEYLIGCEDESKQHVYDISCKLDIELSKLKAKLLTGTKDNKNNLFELNNEHLLLLQCITLLDENITLQKKLSTGLQNNKEESNEGYQSEIESSLKELENEIKELKESLIIAENKQ